MQKQTLEVWAVQRSFQENGTLPNMSETDKAYFLDFATCQVSDSIESYERFTYNHGGTCDEAKSRLKAISDAEKLVKAVRAI